MKIERTENIAFTSDYHIGHKNIIKFSNRPFKEVLEMNEAIRDRHNAVCDKDTIVFNLGDALLLPRQSNRAVETELLREAKSLLQSFKGKIYYLPGNHESDIVTIRECWTLMPPLVDLTVGKGSEAQHIVLCHYALRTWNKAHYGSWHLFGHSHGGLKLDNGTLMVESDRGRCIDVGVDTNDYYPYSFEDVKKIMDNKVFIPSDHHSGKMNGTPSTTAVL